MMAGLDAALAPPPPPAPRSPGLYKMTWRTVVRAGLHGVRHPAGSPHRASALPTRLRLGEAWPRTTSHVSACAALIRHNDLSLQGSHYSGPKVGVWMVGEGTAPKAASRGAGGGAECCPG